MAGSVQGVRLPAASPCGGDIEDGQADGDAQAPIDDPDQIRIGGIIITEAIPSKAEVTADDRRKRVGTLQRRRCAAAARLKALGQVAKQGRIRLQIGFRVIERRKFQRGSIERDRLVIEQAEMGNVLDHSADTGGAEPEFPGFFRFYRDLEEDGGVGPR